MNNQITISLNSLRVIMLVFFVLGLITGILGWKSVKPIPRCPYAPDVIVGNGKYNPPQTGYWSEYNCVSVRESESESIFP